MCVPALPQLTAKWNKSQFHLAQVAEGMQDRLGNDLFYIVILRLRPGSVVGDLLFAVPKEEAVDVNDIQTSLNDVLRSKFGNENEVQGK